MYCNLTFLFQYLARISQKPARCLPRLPPPPSTSWGASGGDQYPSPCPARTLATWENLSSQGDFPQNIYYTFSLIAFFFPFRGDFSASEPCDVFLDVECKARVSFGGGGDGAKKRGSADQETVSKTRWDCRASQFLSRKKRWNNNVEVSFFSDVAAFLFLCDLFKRGFPLFPRSRHAKLFSSKFVPPICTPGTASGPPETLKGRGRLWRGRSL